MAKHRRREQEPSVNENMNRNMMNTNNNPFGIDPMQLLGLLGGNFDMRNMSNMLASMNTNGFNLNNLGPLAQMAGLNLDNNFVNLNNNNNNLNRNNNLNMNSNPNMNSDIQNMSANNMNKNEANSQKRDETVDKRNNSAKVSHQEEKRHERSSNDGMVQEKNKSVDENLEFLISLRSFVHQSKVPFIDKIIDGYKKGLFK